jgi:hypothetical protein
MLEMDGILMSIIAALIFATGVVVGWGVTNDGWKNDCKYLGYHRDGSLVYTCAISSPQPSLSLPTKECT